MNEKIPPEILNRKEHALVGQAEMPLTVLFDGPCISFNDVYPSAVHRLSPLAAAFSRPSTVRPSQFRLSSVPSFHDLRVGFSYRLFAVLVVYMIQHGTSSLRATVTEPVIELVNPLNVRTVLTVENQTAALASADCVHDAEHIPDRFRPL